MSQEAQSPETAEVNRLTQQIRTAAMEPLINPLCGKFHAHLTVAIQPTRLEALGQHCRSCKAKLTVVDLENLSGRSQTDVMVTSYFVDPEPRSCC